MSGGMIQLLKSDGTWKDCFPVGYSSHRAAMSVADKYHTEARIVNRKGQVIFKCEPRQ